MSRPFRTDPDRLDGNEITINEFSGLNNVSPWSLFGQPNILENIYFSKNGGYQPLVSEVFIATAANDGGDKFAGVCAWDNNTTVFTKIFSPTTEFAQIDLQTNTKVTRLVNATAQLGTFNLAPLVVLSPTSFEGAGNNNTSFVFAKNNFSQPWSRAFTGLAPIVYTGGDVAPVTFNAGWIDPAAPDTLNPPDFTPPVADYQYNQNTRVGWAAEVVNAPFNNLADIDYGGAPASATFISSGIAEIMIFWKDKRVPDGGLLQPQLLAPQKLVSFRGTGRFNESKAEYAMIFDHSPDLELFAFGAAYPANRRLYKSGVGVRGTMVGAGTPNPSGYFRNRLPATGVAYVANTVYSFGLMDNPNGTAIKRLILLCVVGGTPTARTAQQQKEFREASWSFGAIFNDTGGVVWQCVNDLNTQFVSFPNSTFEETIKYIQFPPVGWLKTLPNYTAEVEAQWGRLDTVQPKPYRTYVYRNLHIDQTDFPSTSPRMPVAQQYTHHQFRTWCVPSSLRNHTHYDGNYAQNFEEYADGFNPLTVLYSEIDKPWDFRGRFIVPNFRRSSKTTALNGVGNVLIIHGDADACALYGNSEANFQVQHLDISGCPRYQSAVVYKDKYYWYDGSEIQLLEGAGSKSLTVGRIALPRDKKCSITVDHQRDLLYFCFDEETTIYVYSENFDVWSTRTISGFIEANNISKLATWQSLDSAPFRFFAKLDGLPITMRVAWYGLDAGNRAARKRFSSVHFTVENVQVASPPVEVRVTTSVDAEPSVLSTFNITTTELFTKKIYERLRNKQGNIATLTIQIDPKGQDVLLRPPIRIEVSKQGDGRHEH